MARREDPVARRGAISVARLGLWHIFLTILGIRIKDRQATGPKLWVAVAGAVLLTTVAGLGLPWLRLHTGA